MNKELDIKSLRQTYYHVHAMYVDFLTDDVDF